MIITSNQKLCERWKNIRYFAAVVRSPAAVRTAFVGQPMLAWWWRIVMFLHGKPTQTNFPAHFRYACVADGFRFYGWLYRTLALICGLAGFWCWFSSLTDFFWIAFLAASGIYLWITSGLAFSGASQFSSSTGEQVWHLVAFLFFVALFLAAALLTISIQVRQAGWLPDVVNIVITRGAMAFGIGSYLVELAALVANESLPKERRT